MVSRKAAGQVGVLAAFVLALQALAFLWPLGLLVTFEVLRGLTPPQAALVVFGPGALAGLATLAVWLRVPAGERREVAWVLVLAVANALAPFVPFLVFRGP
ncbi:MAG TPA: hypothetical protein VHH36_05380 [Candidatus Thermoplasmatota archaeon]|nr:hypothetical protein [Candidatus Thermoplasmatota archaeon]